jgi:hypothetical protein
VTRLPIHTMATLAAPRLEPERKSAPFRFIAKLGDEPIPFVHTAPDPDPATSFGQSECQGGGLNRISLWLIERPSDGGKLCPGQGIRRPSAMFKVDTFAGLTARHCMQTVSTHH